MKLAEHYVWGVTMREDTGQALALNPKVMEPIRHFTSCLIDIMFGYMELLVIVSQIKSMGTNFGLARIKP